MNVIVRMSTSIPSLPASSDATSHERSAEFHASLAQFFEGRGDDLDATRERERAAVHRRQAMQERIYALKAGAAPHPATVRGQLRLTAYSERKFNYLPRR